MSSFIGCKISLISKAGIRYEGILYTIDPKESTVALSKVKSFGTEDRKVERVIPARDEIYEYIIFRGSDIQDLNVCERSKESTLLLEDSAIVRAETSISGNLPLGVLNAEQHQNDNAWKNGNIRQPVKEKSSNNVKNQQTKEEIDSKPSNNNQTMVSNRQNHQNNEYKKPLVKKTNGYSNAYNESKYERGNIKSEKNQKVADKYVANYQNYEYNKYRGNNYHGSTDYSSSREYNNYENGAGRYGRSDYRQSQYYSSDNYKLRGFESSDHNYDYSYSQYYDYKPTRQVQDRYSHDNSTNKIKRKVNNSESNKTKDAAFKEDYDFETANAIIAKELANMNISQDKADLKDEEHQDIKEDGEICEELDAAYYDKNKSFFDKISSEMIDRANGKIVRPMNRKEERKMNVETFGVAETSRSGGRNSGKWSRGGGGGAGGVGGGRYGAKTGRSQGYVEAGFRGHNSMDGGYGKKDGPQKSMRGYNSGRRVVSAGGPGRGDVY